MFRLDKPHFESLEPRVLLSSSPAGYDGFTVSGNKVYDSADQEFIIRGFNHTMYWGNATQTTAAIATFDQTEANAVRLVFTNDPAHTWSNSETWAKRKAAIDAVIAEGMVPIIEFHNATGGEDLASLNAIVDTWVADAANLQPYEEKVIINIANEWGPNHANKTFNGKSAEQYWADAYANAISRIRNAGIDSLLMVDAGMWAQDARFIRDKGQAVLNSDPHQNVIFSLHMYRQWYDPGAVTTNYGQDWARFDVQTELNYIKNTLNLPIFIGEFSWEGANDVQANDGTGNTYTTRKIMEVAHNLGVGWTAWSWHDNSDPKLDMLQDGKWLFNGNDLTAFGNLIINDGQYGLRATAQPAAGFGTGSSGGGGASGSITRELWNGVTGNTVASIPVNSTPSSTTTLNRFEAPSNVGNNYGQRIRGTLTAPTSGWYRFWIAGDDHVELNLSTDASAGNKTRIAYHNGWTSSQQWNKYGTQKSNGVYLNAGSEYYIEALMKESGGGDNLAVGWAKPGQGTNAPSEVIPGSVLSPANGSGNSGGGSTNLLNNGGFDNGTTNWNTWYSGGASGSFGTQSTSGMSGNALRATINNGSDALWKAKATQNVNLIGGQTYQLTFKAKAEWGRTIRVDAKQNGGSWSWYGGQAFTATSTPRPPGGSVMRCGRRPTIRLRPCPTPRSTRRLCHRRPSDARSVSVPISPPAPASSAIGAASITKYSSKTTASASSIAARPTAA